MAVFVALYVALWFSWVGFTLYANRFDTDDVVFRIAKLAATASIAGCAASASAATGDFSTPFALCFLAGRVILLLLHLRGGGTCRRPGRLSPAFDGAVRYGLWAAAVAMDAVGPVVATRREDRAPLHMEHLPERFGLFIILVLGEAVGGAATGVHDAKWSGSAVAVGIAGFVVAAALWWNYFDVTAGHSEEELQENDDGDGEEEESPTSGTTCSSTATSRSRPGSSWPGSVSRTWWRTRSTLCRPTGAGPSPPGSPCTCSVRD